jgi:ABC-type amino acid transport system permease subunit
MAHILSALFSIAIHFGSVLVLFYYALKVEPVFACVGLGAFFAGMVMMSLVNSANAAEAARRKLEIEATLK